MPAQAQHTIWSAYLASVSGAIVPGMCLVLNAAGDGYVVATSANRTAAGRRAAGIALSSGGANEPVEMQVVGVVSAAVSGLGAGAASSVRVSTAGALERVGSPGPSDDLVGRCDTDGTVYVAFGALSTSVASSTPTGTGFRHVTSGTEDAASKLVVNADVDAAAAIAASKVVQATGTGFPHVTGGALDVASVKVDLGATADVTVPGSNGQFFWRSSGVLAGSSGIATDGTYLGNGATVPATGFVRLAYNAASAVPIITAKDSVGADRTFLQYGSGDAWTIGNAGQDATIDCYSLTVNGATNIDLTSGVGARISMWGRGSWIVYNVSGVGYLLRSTGSSLDVGQPIHGDTASSSPWGVHGRAVVTPANGSNTVAAADYAMGMIKVDPSSLTSTATLVFPHPADEAHSYTKIVKYSGAPGGYDVTISTGTGSTVTLPGNSSAGGGAPTSVLLAFTPDGVEVAHTGV